MKDNDSKLIWEAALEAYRVTELEDDVVVPDGGDELAPTDISGEDPIMELILDIEAKIDEIADQGDVDDDSGATDDARRDVIQKIRKGLDVIENQIPTPDINQPTDQL